MLAGARRGKRSIRVPAKNDGEGELCSPEPVAGGFGNPLRVPAKNDGEGELCSPRSPSPRACSGAM